MRKSPIHYGDSYKYGRSGQYPTNMVGMYYYLSSRGGLYPSTIFVGLQGLLKEYMSKPITMAEVDKLHVRAMLHGIPFDYDGWKYIVEEHRGILPVKIKAIPEGTLVPVGLPLVIVESTDTEVAWVAGFVETLLLKVWYPTTIATKSYYVRKMLEEYGDPAWAKFAFHAFGDRACTSPESAAIAGFAHVAAGFYGTDNFDSLEYCEEFYGVPVGSVAAFSVFATEHSTTTAYGVDGEEQFVYDQLLRNPDAPIMSFVADSYDVYKFTDFCTHPKSRIRALIESRPNQKLVLRPDSGDPIEVLDNMISIMRRNKLRTVPLEKHLFQDYGILWGDGITPSIIEDILIEADNHNFAAENFVFGSGGDLMQNVTRDTQQFAIKCSSIKTVRDIADGMGNPVYTTVDVFKDPITAPGKKSLKGRVTTYVKDDETFFLHTEGNAIPIGASEALIPVWENGILLQEYTLEGIRRKNQS